MYDFLFVNSKERTGLRMASGYAENNAETGRRKDAGLIDESLIENKVSASVIDAAIEVHRV